MQPIGRVAPWIGNGTKRARKRNARRADIARVLHTRRALGTKRVTARTLTRAQIRALRDLCGVASQEAVTCTRALEGDAKALSRVVTEINRRIKVRAKET